MRIVVREDFSKSRCDALINDFKLALKTLDAMDEKKLQAHREHRQQMAVERRNTLIGRLTHSAPQNPFLDEKHSLQGKTGKTHQVC